MNSKQPAFVRDSTDETANFSERLTVQVSLGPRSYEIDIVSDRLAWLARYLENCLVRLPSPPRRPYQLLIVTDGNVAKPHAATVRHSLDNAGWHTESVELQPGEQSKSLAVVSGIYDRLVEMQAGRHTIVVAVGGGVVGDVAGFVAATYARGIPFIQVPTSLLAHVDSSVGGKVGVNHPRGKNLIGAFHQPIGVFIDTVTLETLSDRDYTSGLAEVIKYGVILDDEFFAYLEENVGRLAARAPNVLRRVIARCCRLKADIVEADEEERTGLRAVLNYGHTFAHAFEALCGYGELLHGEAVAVGMVCAGRLAEFRQLIDSSFSARQCSLIDAVGLPTRLPASIKLTATDVLDRMRLDKKTVAGQLHFVLPTELGHVEVYSDVPETDVRSALDEVLA